MPRARFSRHLLRMRLRNSRRIACPRVEAIAVCLLHSYANPRHERRIGELLRVAHPDLS